MHTKSGKSVYKSRPKSQKLIRRVFVQKYGKITGKTVVYIEITLNISHGGVLLCLSIKNWSWTMLI